MTHFTSHFFLLRRNFPESDTSYHTLLKVSLKLSIQKSTIHKMQNSVTVFRGWKISTLEVSNTTKLNNIHYYEQSHSHYKRHDLHLGSWCISSVDFFLRQHQDYWIRVIWMHDGKCVFFCNWSGFSTIHSWHGSAQLIFKMLLAVCEWIYW